MQVERNLHDAMGVARNVMMDPRLVPGGGAVEMAISRGLYERSASIQGTQQVLTVLQQCMSKAELPTTIRASHLTSLEFMLCAKPVTAMQLMASQRKHA